MLFAMSASDRIGGIFAATCCMVLAGAALVSTSARATDIPKGNVLYNTWCAGCHSADPRQSQPHLAANNPTVLRDAMDLVGQMNFLKSVLSVSDIADIAAFIGSVVTTGVVVLNPTPAAVDFSYQTVGAPSPPQTMLLTNLGSLPLNVVAVSVTRGDFTLTGSCIGNRNPSSTCALQLTLNPLAAGSIAGYLRVDIAGAADPVLVPLLGAGVLPASTPLPIVVEYFNPDLDNYFITANAAEQVVVESGVVGRWQRTGNAFRSAGSGQVCRFYGNGTTNTASGRPYGPNSHFYTIDQHECDGLRALFDPGAPSWHFESLDFSAAAFDGSHCAPGTVPVYRAYNNGQARGIDSNHRITTNRTAIDQVVARGWIDEGVVMCAADNTAGITMLSGSTGTSSR